MLDRFSIFPITPKLSNKCSTILVAISQNSIVERGLGCIENIYIYRKKWLQSRPKLERKNNGYFDARHE
jgi:hypothetical protein